MDTRTSLGWVLAGSALAGTVFISLGRVHPMVELFSNLRLHALVGSVVVLLLVATLREFRAVAVVATAIAINAWFVVPYFVGSSADPLPANGDGVMRVLQYNVLYLNDDFDGIANEILGSDADVVALHELTHRQWSAVSMLTEDDYPFALAEPEYRGESGSTGRALLSRTPLTQVSPTGPAVPIAATTVLGEREVLVVGLHPSPSRHAQSKIDRRNQKLEATVELVADHAGPAIVISDLNIAPTSHEYSDFVDDLGWNDPRSKVGWEATWSRPPDPLGLPIDHVFVSNELRLHDYELGDGGGSDHRSLVAVISFDTTGLDG